MVHKELNRKLPAHVKRRFNVPNEIGIEIELEGQNFGRVNQDIWNKHQDGSLRRGGIELIFREPQKVGDVKGIMEAWADINKNAIIYPSIRTSTHIHLNMCQHTLLDLYKFLTFYYMVEDMLITSQGKDRESNLFCLSLADTEAFFEKIIQGIFTEDFLLNIAHSDTRYGALNLCALNKFGSIEFRFLKGIDLNTYKDVWLWATELHRAFQIASEFDSPASILTLFRDVKNEEFLQTFFSANFINTILLPSVREKLGLFWDSIINDRFHYVYRMVTALEPHINVSIDPLQLENKHLFKRPKIYPANEDMVPNAQLNQEINVHV